jgi:hypothetical protein
VAQRVFGRVAWFTVCATGEPLIADLSRGQIPSPLRPSGSELDAGRFLDSPL